MLLLAFVPQLALIFFPKYLFENISIFSYILDFVLNFILLVMIFLVKIIIHV